MSTQLQLVDLFHKEERRSWCQVFITEVSGGGRKCITKLKGMFETTNETENRLRVNCACHKGNLRLQWEEEAGVIKMRKALLPLVLPLLETTGWGLGITPNNPRVLNFLTFHDIKSAKHVNTLLILCFRIDFVHFNNKQKNFFIYLNAFLHKKHKNVHGKWAVCYSGTQ